MIWLIWKMYFSIVHYEFLYRVLMKNQITLIQSNSFQIQERISFFIDRITFDP